jgi:hypothetical protein
MAESGRSTLLAASRRLAMGIALSCCVVSALLVSTCSGATPAAERRLTKLFDHWRWKQYWDDTTELGTLYSPGRKLHVVLFWRKDDAPPSLGFCSIDLGVCQFYPDIAHAAVNTEMKIPEGDDQLSAYRRFLQGSFALGASLPAGPPPRKADFSFESTDIVLPVLDPPDAIKERAVRPAAETEALVADQGCAPDPPNCKLHLMVPFYGEKDLWVPVYRECPDCHYGRPMILFMRYVEGHWWHGAMDFDDRRDSVDGTRRKIERALMLEVRR